MAEGALDSNFGAIIDTVSDGVYVTAADREIVFWRKWAERYRLCLWGSPSSTLLRQHPHTYGRERTESLLHGLPATEMCSLGGGAASGSGGVSQAQRTVKGWQSTWRLLRCWLAISLT